MFTSGFNYFLGYYGSRGFYPYQNRHERLHKKNPIALCSYSVFGLSESKLFKLPELNLQVPMGYWILQCLQEEKGKELASADPFTIYNVVLCLSIPIGGSGWDPKMMLWVLRKCCSHTLSSLVDT